MLAISKMKALILSSLSPLPLTLPKTQSLAFFSIASNSFLCNPESFRLSSSISGKALVGFRKSPSLAIPCRALRSDASPSASGEIHVIVGPMFAGKTTSLLRRVQSERSNGRNVAIIKSNKDNRYGLDSIVTHDGEKLPCLALSNLLSYREMIGTDAYGQLDVIGIDEAQFFEDLYDFCREAADQDGKMVIVAGLDGDYLRRSFGSVLDIIPLADSVTKLTSRCELCGKRAFFTLRKTDETRTELIGGAEVYMPVCRHHYVSGQGVVEAARGFLEYQNVHQCSL